VEPIPLAAFVVLEATVRGMLAMSKAEEAFSRAAMCADQAQAAQDEERRTFFKRLRDSRFHGCARRTTISSHSPWPLTPRPAGMIMSGLEAVEAPPER
jgi:hypothetical protein